ncbi:MAG: adenylate/guanylate cyclase domain-containing protein [Pseudomonadota bacterium]
MSETTTLIQPSSRTLICSVLFLDIVEYSKKSVSGQIKLKDRFNTLLSQAISHVVAMDRIILDTGDGAAISFLGDPEEALIVAFSLRNALLSEMNDPELPLLVRIGINLGPVKLVKDINGQPNIIGDGINVAQRVMSFAEPGQVLISRSYYDVVSRMSQEYGRMFQYLGSHTDKHIREHEIYAFVPPGETVGMPTAAPAMKPGAPATHSFFDDLLQNKTLAYIVGGMAITLILVFSLIPRGEKPVPQEQVPQVPQEQVAQTAPTPTADASAKQATPQPATSKKPATPAAAALGAAPDDASPIPPAKQARILLAIFPWGEVYVDGKFEGVSPPLKELVVTPGKHEVVIKNTFFPNHTETVNLKAKGRVKIKHKFPQ